MCLFCLPYLSFLSPGNCHPILNVPVVSLLWVKNVCMYKLLTAGDYHSQNITAIRCCIHFFCCLSRKLQYYNHQLFYYLYCVVTKCMHQVSWFWRSLNAKCCFYWTVPLKITRFLKQPVLRCSTSATPTRTLRAWWRRRPSGPSSAPTRPSGARSANTPHEYRRLFCWKNVT